MAVCEYLVGRDITANCTNLIRPGLQGIGYIINKSDIESVSESDGIVDGIALKTGKKAYQIQQVGQRPFNGTNIQLQQGDFVNTFNKVVSFVILDNSPSISKEVVEPLANGEFVVILENKYADEADKNYFEIVGLETGARATDLSQDKYENQAGWTVELTEAETPVANKFFFDTDYQKTQDALEALLTPAE